MSNQDSYGYGYDHYERQGYEQPSYPPRHRGPGMLELAVEKLGGWALGITFAPLWVVFTDSSAAVRKRASEESPKDMPAKTIGLFIFPILLAIVAVFTDARSLIVAASGPIAWLALAKRLPARRLIDFSTAKIFTSVMKLSKPLLIGSGVAIAASTILAILDRGSLAGIPVVLAGYPLAIALGRQRIKEHEIQHANDASDRRLIGLALGLSEAQAAAMDVYRTGSEASESLQIHAGQLPLDVIGKLAGAAASVAAHAPAWELVSASADGIILGPASDETLARREQLRQTGGLVAGVSEAQPPAAGPSTSWTTSTDGFAPGDVF